MLRSSQFHDLEEKAKWVRRETLKIHKTAPGTRIASSLSCVEIFVALFYGKIINFNPADVSWEQRDRLIISKGHGSICFYPILADLGYFDKAELIRVGQEGSFLGSIPDIIIPGYETINGSLGHGLGVACGIALALKKKNREEKVFVLIGDGELYEGSVWEAIMFAGEHKLDNLILIIDNNKTCMLDYCKNIIDLEPICDKFKPFKWHPTIVNGHDLHETYNILVALKKENKQKPKVLIANTIKGKGVPRLEIDSLNHIKTLKPDEIDKLIEELQ